VLFGDGAGAMVLTSTEATEEGGMLGYEMHSDGTGYSNLQVSSLERRCSALQRTTTRF